jgi:hypothetical protein
MLSESVSFYQIIVTFLSQNMFSVWRKKANKPTAKPNKSVPRHCLLRYRLNLEVQGELLWFLICFLNETMLVFNLTAKSAGQVCRPSLPAKSTSQVCRPSHCCTVQCWVALSSV